MPDVFILELPFLQYQYLNLAKITLLANNTYISAKCANLQLQGLREERKYKAVFRCACEYL